jgi:hypothetical protein
MFILAADLLEWSMLSLITSALVMNINYPSVMPEVCFIHIEVSCMMFHSSVFFDSSAAVKKAAHKANPLGACDSAT